MRNTFSIPLADDSYLPAAPSQNIVRGNKISWRTSETANWLNVDTFRANVKRFILLYSVCQCVTSVSAGFAVPFSHFYKSREGRPRQTA